MGSESLNWYPDHEVDGLYWLVNTRGLTVAMLEYDSGWEVSLINKHHRFDVAARLRCDHLWQAQQQILDILGDDD